MRTLGLIIVALIVIFIAGDVSAQGKKATEIQPAEILAEGWEEIDERLIFLIIRLANTETTLEAVEKAIAAETKKKAPKVAAAKKAEIANEVMDRNGGGPVKWSKFYGTTAEKFFYHPSERKTTYNTDLVLGQSTQVVQTSSRPPQFDYIYRANEKAKARAEAEAAEIQGGIQSLIERRNRLEAEQAGLWVEIAFRAVQHFDLDKKPVFRFEPIAEVRENEDAMKAAASFMATALSLVNEADEDQAGTFSKIKPTISKARQELNDSWLRLGIESPNRQTNLGRFAALAKRLNDVASNLSESYLVAMEGAQAKDQQRKETFRGTLQTSLISYAQIILALDEMSTLLKDEWKTKPALDKPLQFVSSKQIVVIPAERSVIASPKVESCPEQRSKYVGKWRVLNKKGGTIFIITLDDAGNSISTNGDGHTGKWEVVDNEVRITWGGDWRDIIRAEKDGYHKVAFKPGTTWTDKPIEDLKVAHDSTSQ